jgi:hypothetical protein
LDHAAVSPDSKPSSKIANRAGWYTTVGSRIRLESPVWTSAGAEPSRLERRMAPVVPEPLVMPSVQ